MTGELPDGSLGEWLEGIDADVREQRIEQGRCPGCGRVERKNGIAYKFGQAIGFLVLVTLVVVVVTVCAMALDHFARWWV